MKARRIALFAALVLVVLALDQGSKAWARTLPMGVPNPVVTGYWDWQHDENPGAAFSTFIGGDVARVLLSAIAAIAIVAIGIAAWRTRPEHRLRRAAFAMILGGAAGNLVD